MKLDLLAFGAHPDDVEFACAGTMIVMARKGYRTGIVDLTRGELSTRGNLRTRAAESAAGAKIMGVRVRRNLNMPDGNVAFTQANLRKVITVLREFRPRIILTPYSIDRHPDHSDASALVRRAVFYAGLKKIVTRAGGAVQQTHRPEVLLQYRQSVAFTPSLVVDITDVFEDRMRAVRAYASQLHDPKNPEANTFISRPEFIDSIEARAREFGFFISVKYGEGFFSPQPLWNGDLTTLLPDVPRVV